MKESRKDTGIRSIRILLLLMALLLVALDFTSCSPCCVPVFKPNCCLCGRRPQVMMSWEDYVWDYNQICPVEDYMDQPEKQCEICKECEKRSLETQKNSSCGTCNQCGKKGCDGSCGKKCGEKCGSACTDSCGDSCNSQCADSCDDSCNSQCADSCGNDCGNLCADSCGSTCEDVCDNSCGNACSSCGRKQKGGIVAKELPEDAFSPIPASGTYTMSPGDIMDIAVFEDEDTYVENVVIPPDGKLYYTFLEGVQVEGKTVQEVRNEVADNLQDLFIDPLVSIVPKELANKTFKVMGRVNEPGIYLLQGPTRLREGIGLAGGVLKEDTNFQDRNTPLESTANLAKSYLVRDGQKLPVNFEKLLYDGDDSQNIYLRPGDFIYLHPTGLREVYILGGVRAAGRVEWQSNITLSKALVSAGAFELGFPGSPDITKILVIRGKLHCPCVMCVNYKDILNGRARDVYLAPGDIIYVSNKQVRFGRAMVRLAIDSFINSFVVGFTSYYSFREWFPVDGQTADEVIVE